MKLREILADIETLRVAAPEELEITGISYDSRHVQPGDLFVAVTGYAADGHKFIPMAVEKGAAAVLCEHAPESESPMCRWKIPGWPWRWLPQTFLDILRIK